MIAMILFVDHVDHVDHGGLWQLFYNGSCSREANHKVPDNALQNTSFHDID